MVVTVKYPIVISVAFQHFRQIWNQNGTVKMADIQPTRTGYPIHP